LGQACLDPGRNLASITGLHGADQLLRRADHEKRGDAAHPAIPRSIVILIHVTLVDGKFGKFFEQEVPIYPLTRSTPICREIDEGYAFELWTVHGLELLMR